MTEREIAEKMIADAERIAKAGKDKLAELDKPELRHGDCFYGKISQGGFFYDKTTNHARNETPGMGQCDASNNFRGVPVQFNAYDILERNSEDLREFAVKDTCNDEGVVLLNGRDVHFRFGKGLVFTSDQATEIHQKLGQLIATAKRKK